MASLPAQVQRFLVPAAAPVGFVRLGLRLLGGLPVTIPLDEEVALVIVVPTGLAAAWREADPTSVVSRSTPELTPVAAPVGGNRAPARLLVRVEGAIVGSVPLVANLHRRLPDDAARVEVMVISWDLRAGSLRGPGDVGSRLELAWRRTDQGTDLFAPPPLHPALLARLDHTFRDDSGPTVTPYRPFVDDRPDGVTLR